MGRTAQGFRQSPQRRQGWDNRETPLILSVLREVLVAKTIQLLWDIFHNHRFCFIQFLFFFVAGIGDLVAEFSFIPSDTSKPVVCILGEEQEGDTGAWLITSPRCIGVTNWVPEVQHHREMNGQIPWPISSKVNLTQAYLCLENNFDVSWIRLAGQTRLRLESLTCSGGRSRGCWRWREKGQKMARIWR